jgi:hypothetical protein
MKVGKFILLIAFFVLVQNQAYCQDYKFHKVYIYNFAKNIQWPTAQQSGDFVIGVLGKSEITTELQSLADTKTLGTQKIVVKTFATVNDVSDCHMLFIGQANSKALTELSSKIGGKPVVIVTEKSGLCKQGSGINFVLVDNKLKYELNKTILDKSGVKVSAELARLAATVYE